MKIEIGESLTSSYFNHIMDCRVIQLNWKLIKIVFHPTLIDKMVNFFRYKVNYNNYLQSGYDRHLIIPIINK
jgi:hypothetical protein